MDDEISATPSGDAAPDTTAAPTAPTAPAAPSPSSPTLTVEQRITAAVAAWTSQLIDVGGRNNLLYYRDLRAGTIDLAAARPPAIESLLAGRPVRISNLYPNLDERTDVLRRARTIHGKAREHFEEKGIQTLYLAAGLASWTNQRTTSKPAAPILLRPAEFRTRGAAQDDFELQLTGEMEVNPVLLHWLKQEFGREIVQDALLDRLDGVIDTPWELEEAYAWLANEARVIPGFSVAPRLIIGTFLYAKLPMVRDLEASTSRLAGHDLIAAIAGDPAARDRLRDRHAGVRVDATEPDRIAPDDEYLVLDANSSQNVAINRVLRGEDLIIKGPPGTGKSQTIANLIASLLALDKRVLFVAEKRAAIDAVFKRLEGVGLSDMLLDIHGGAGARRHTAENLAKALGSMATAPLPPVDGLADDLVRSRARLAGHAAAMHARRPPWNLSLVEAIDRAAQLSVAARTDLRLKPDDIERLGETGFEAARRDLREFVDLGGATVTASPWATATIDDAETARSTYDRCTTLRGEAFPAARDALWAALAETGLPPAENTATIDARLAAWTEARRILGLARPEIFEADLDRLATDVEPARGVVTGLVAMLTSGRYRTARREAMALLLDPRASGRTMHEAVTSAHALRAAWTAIAGPEGRPSVPERLDEVVAAETHVRTETAALADIIGAPGLTDPDLDRDDLAAWLDRLIADRSTLLRLPDLRRTHAALVAAGLLPIVHHVTAAKLPPEQVGAVLEWAWLNSIIERIEFVEPALAAFDADQLRASSVRYAGLDHRHLARTAQRVRRRYAEHGIAQRDAYPDEAAIITKQAALKRGHLPLRDLFRSAPHALLGVKPCWAMSPLVVSQVLPDDQTYFDVVIFDEASQVTPADAIPSIMRGRSVVVAGDDRQLPPTSFFLASQPEDEDAEANEETSLTLTQGFESVLDSLAPILPTTSLDWHYRSQDERLIAFSNREFYDGRLVTFPGVAGHGAIEQVLVASGSAAGQEESSSAEVREVIARVLRHAVEHPDESLGVIAMGITHAGRIEDALRVALRGRTDVEAFFDETRAERFFVKNLERVQGDERDAIILSVGYGKTADGRLLYRFGPINLEGGERRLNVAITRARRRMTVISSFTSAEMDPERTRSRGAQLLRGYLAYAERAGRGVEGVGAGSPGVGARPASDPPAETDLASTVRDALVERGLTAEVRLGSSGHWIDVAVSDPDDVGRYVLAVETDGRGYHEIPTTRDRDRLRREQLERLGWRHHRLWSVEWLRDREAAADLIEARARGAVDAGASSPAEVAADTAAPGVLAAIPVAGGVARGPRPYLGAYDKIDDIPFSRLVELIDWIESDGILRTVDEVVTLAVDALGFHRRGSRIDASLRNATTFARSRRKA